MRWSFFPSLVLGVGLSLVSFPGRGETGPSPSGSGLKIGQVVPVADIPAVRNIVPPDTEARFLGDDYGITAYFLVQQKKGKVVYVTPDGQGVMDGSLFGGDGTSATLQQLTRLRESGFDPIPFIAASMMAAANTAQQMPPGTASPPVAAPEGPAGGQGQPVFPEASGGGASSSSPSSSSPAASSASTSTSTSTAAPAPGSLSEQLWQEVNAASWIAFGQPSAPTVTVMMDPLCDHCHTYFKQLLPYVQKGKIYLRVVPVAVLDPDKGAPLLVNVFSSTSPAAAWTSLVNGQAVPPPASVNPRALPAVKANGALFARWNLPGTPYAVYRDKAAGQVKRMFSAPKDMNAFLAEVGVTP